MGRIVKEYDERYAEFLDVAQELFYSKGYEQTSVQEIINAVNVAKGTFYHYFASKAELLDALIDRMIEQMLDALAPLVADDSLEAMEKFERFFTYINNWKAANRNFLLDTIRVLYQDENVLLRTKMQVAGMAMATPLLAQIIRQGIREKSFDVAYPEEIAEIVFTMGRACSDAMVSLLLADEWNDAARRSVERKLITYERSIERVLGAPEGSLRLIDPDILDVWLPQRE